MKISTLLSVLLLASLAGCFGSRGLRPVSMEMSDSLGSWRLDGIQQASLQRTGWRMDIVESAVAPNATIPRLEALYIEIVNTGPEPITIRPNEITLTGLTSWLFLGPDNSVTLQEDQRYLIEYDPGLRAPVLMYPFDLNITIFRGSQQSPDPVKIILY